MDAHETLMRQHPLQRKLRGEKVTPEDWGEWETALRVAMTIAPSPEPVSKPVEASSVLLSANWPLSPPYTYVDQQSLDPEEGIVYEVVDGESVVTIY